MYLNQLYSISSVINEFGVASYATLMPVVFWFLADVEKKGDALVRDRTGSSLMGPASKDLLEDEVVFGNALKTKKKESKSVVIFTNGNDFNYSSNDHIQDDANASTNQQSSLIASENIPATTNSVLKDFETGIVENNNPPVEVQALNIDQSQITAENFVSNLDFSW